MRKLFLFVLLLSFLIGQRQAFAVTNQTTVNANVGQFKLTLSGFASPNASIALLNSEDGTLATTVADSKGNFSFSVDINEGFSRFCFLVTDFKRLGESHTCIDIPPAEANVSKNDIFLPPTIALSGRRLTPNASVFAYGYTMPNASVDLNLGSKIVKIKADSSGFYKVEIKNLLPGKYSLFATANFEGKDSEKPDRKLTLESVSAGEEITEKGKSLLDRILDFLRRIVELIITYLWIVIPALILLIILLPRRVRERIKLLLKKFPFGAKVPPKEEQKNLHHAWIFGY